MKYATLKCSNMKWQFAQHLPRGLDVCCGLGAFTCSSNTFAQYYLVQSKAPSSQASAQSKLDDPAQLVTDPTCANSTTGTRRPL